MKMKMKEYFFLSNSIRIFCLKLDFKIVLINYHYKMIYMLVRRE